MLVLMNCSADVPLLVRVTREPVAVVASFTVPKATLCALRVKLPIAPVPDKATLFWARVVSAGVTKSDAALAPPVVGANVTLMVQLVPAATLMPQPFVSR